jgi:peptidoglycan/xylan/chitin deacetylase (PgdA/CDA1 family)
VPIALLYHAVFELPPQRTEDLRTLVVDPSELDWQLGALRASGRRSLSLEEFHEGRAGVLLSFDDAYAHVFPVVTPLLERHGCTAVMFVPWEHIGGANDWDAPPLPVAGLAIAGTGELQAAAAGPWELASHGLRHVDLRGLPRPAATEELAAGRERLSALAGREVVDLAYPYGLYTGETKAAAREAGFRAAFAVDAADGSDRFAIPRRVIRGQESRTAFRIKVDEEVGRLFG